MAAEEPTRCPDCNGIVADMATHRAGCSRYQARMAAAHEARRPRELHEMGRDAQVVCVAAQLRKHKAQRLARPSDDLAVAWAVRNRVDDPDVLLLAHALCCSNVPARELRAAAYNAHYGGMQHASLFDLLGIAEVAA